MTGLKWLTRAVLVLGCCVLTAGSMRADETESVSGRPLTLVVMDPLAAPLSCPCVEGYAQRKYEVLAKHLKESLGRDVKLVFAEALDKALSGGAGGRADVIIGKDSVVRADAKAAKIKATAVARLTDKTGSTTQHGLIVVNKADPARKAADLTGYHIIFGPVEAEEKHQAALELLKDAGVEPPAELAIDQACSDGACKVIELGPDANAAAVISSYAAPLLEGCGTIKKGDLRVVAKTKPVPFVTAFTTNTVSRTERDEIQQALLVLIEKPEMCEALESLLGFVAVETEKVAAKKN